MLVGLGTDLGGVLPCLALLYRNASGTGEHLGGIWSSSCQLIPVSYLLLLVRERHEWGWRALESAICSLGVSADRGFHLISLSFCHSPQALGERH